MSDIVTSATACAEAGLSVMPLQYDKTGKPKKPALKSWKALQSAALSPEEAAALFDGHDVRGLELTGATVGLAVICGDVSGGVELIDVDSAKDPNGTIWEDLRRAIAYDDAVSGLFGDLYIERTVSGGYHILYRYDVPTGRQRDGNQALARAPRTEAEPAKVGKAIIETRGEGGYCVTAPTPGYETVQGDLCDLPHIESHQRDRLIELCRRLTYETAPETSAPAEPSPPRRTQDGLSPLDDYNARATLETVADLLTAHGWTIPYRNAGRIYVSRPDDGTAHSEQSGNIAMCTGTGGATQLPLLKVHSTNAAPFSPNREDGRTHKAYRPGDVYTLLEHAGDYKAAAKALYREGYGDRRSPAEELDAQDITVTYKNNVNKENTEIPADTVTICRPGEQPLSREDVLRAPVDAFTLTASEGSREIEQAIYLIQGAKKYAYIQLAGEDGQCREVRDYRYLAQVLLSRYEGDDLSDRDIDELRLDIVRTSRRLRIHDRHPFIRLCLDSGAGDAGISERDLERTAEELDAQHRQENDTKSIQAALRQADALIAAGKPYDAAKAMQAASKLTDTRADLSALLAPLTEERLRDAIQGQAGDVPTGYNFWMDDKTFELCLPAAALSVIAARTGHRKTSLLMNMAVNIARNNEVQGDVYFLTYEETAADLLLKMMTLDIDRDEVPLDYIKAYYRQGMPADNFVKTAFRSGKARFMRELIGTGRLRVMYPGLPARALCSMIRQLQQEGRIAAVFIDYIQQLRIPELATQSRQVQLQEICEQLRDTAISTGLPLILGAQFNREVSQEKDIESSKIREAGDIEQTANLVLGLWDRRQTRAGHENRDNKKAGGPTPGELYAEILKGRAIGTGADAVLKYNAITWKVIKN
jgi:replicative DNA helicase